MIREEKDYIEFLDWKDEGIRIIYTKKSYGNIMEKTHDELRHDFSLGERKIITGKQIHGNHIVCVEETDTFFFEDTDGFLTKNKDTVLLTKYADCMPVFFYDPVQEVIGVVHSGWKGSFQEISGKAIEKMCQRYGSKVEQIRVILGVGISSSSYEVGEDFFQTFCSHFPLERLHQSFIQQGDRIFFNNQEFIVQTLLERGISSEHIIGNELCTFQGDFHSYRRDRNQAGRNGALIYFSSKTDTEDK